MAEAKTSSANNLKSRSDSSFYIKHCWAAGTLQLESEIRVSSAHRRPCLLRCEWGTNMSRGHICELLKIKYSRCKSLTTTVDRQQNVKKIKSSLDVFIRLLALSLTHLIVLFIESFVSRLRTFDIHIKSPSRFSRAIAFTDYHLVARDRVCETAKRALEIEIPDDINWARRNKTESDFHSPQQLQPYPENAGEHDMDRIFCWLCCVVVISTGWAAFVVVCGWEQN